MTSVRLIQFTDILCVWAYATQVRVDHLIAREGEHIELDARFCSVFGNARVRLERRWEDRGGLDGYAAHVRDVCERFDHVTVHPETWSRVAPRSSMNAHIFLAAVRGLEVDGEVEVGSFQAACSGFREGFFRDARDVGLRSTHYEIAEAQGLPIAAIEGRLGTGAAHASLARDFDLASEHEVRVSPTLLLNEGRQRLTGNVGFRVIEANVRELSRARDHDDASWC